MSHASEAVVRSKSRPDPSSRSISVRPLGSLERLFWNLDQNRPVHFVIAAEIEGRTSVQAWGSAIGAAQRRHPLLSCGIGVGDDGRPRWYQGTSFVPLRVVEGRSPLAWEGEIERELSDPFALGQAPLVRATIIHSEDRCVFLLSAHHAVADGLSLAFVLRDVLRSLAGEDLESYSLPPAQETLLGGTSPHGESATSPESTPSPVPRPGTYRAPGRGSVVVRRLRLDADLTRQLRDRSRHEGTTVHAALNAAIAYSAGPTAEGRVDGALRIFSPINARGFLGLGEECVLRLGAGTVSVKPGETSAFWEVARRANRDIQGSRTSDAARALGEALGQVFSENPDVRMVAKIAAQAFAYEVMLTNLGKDPIATRFGPLRIDALWGPAVLFGYEGEQTVGAVTLNDSLCLTHTSYAPIPRLLEDIERTLSGACE